MSFSRQVVHGLPPPQTTGLHDSLTDGIAFEPACLRTALTERDPFVGLGCFDPASVRWTISGMSGVIPLQAGLRPTLGRWRPPFGMGEKSGFAARNFLLRPTNVNTFFRIEYITHLGEEGVMKCCVGGLGRFGGGEECNISCA